LSLIRVFVIIYQRILNLTTADNLLAEYTLVAYRSQNPSKATVDRVLKELQENKIDPKQLVKWPDNHCQPAKSSTQRGSSA
jgi:hypothetical protein